MLIRYFALLVALTAPLTLLSDDLGDELLAAARKSDVEAVRALLAKGADVNAKTSYGQTPLFFACDRGNLRIVTMLLDKGANVNAKDTFYNTTALTWAAMKKRIDVVKLLLDKGAEDVEGALMYGVGEGNADICESGLGDG
jgi:ankyrin repeat protein